MYPKYLQRASKNEYQLNLGSKEDKIFNVPLCNWQWMSNELTSSLFVYTTMGCAIAPRLWYFNDAHLPNDLLLLPGLPSVSTIPEGTVGRLVSLISLLSLVWSRENLEIAVQGRHMGLDTMVLCRSSTKCKVSWQEYEKCHSLFYHATIGKKNLSALWVTLMNVVYYM